MKYLVATFNIETTADLMQACQDLLADGAAEAGFESFEETETGMEAYVQKDLFDKEALDEYIADFPIMDTRITYDIKDAEDKDQPGMGGAGLRPIFVADQVVIYDAKHPELYPDTSNRPDIIEIGIEAKLAFNRQPRNHPHDHLATAADAGEDQARAGLRYGNRHSGTHCLQTGRQGSGGLRHRRMERGERQAQCRAERRRQHGGALRQLQCAEPRERRFRCGDGEHQPQHPAQRHAPLPQRDEHRRSLILSGFYEEDVPVLLEKAAELGLHEVTRQVDNNWTCLVLG